MAALPDSASRPVYISHRTGNRQLFPNQPLSRDLGEGRGDDGVDPLVASCGHGPVFLRFHEFKVLLKQASIGDYP